MHTFFATLGSDHPGYPGYYAIEVHADPKGRAQCLARDRMQQHTAGKWAFMYTDIDELHPMDRVFRRTLRWPSE